jgi:hypothetical protein
MHCKGHADCLHAVNRAIFIKVGVHLYKIGFIWDIDLQDGFAQTQRRTQSSADTDQRSGKIPTLVRAAALRSAGTCTLVALRGPCCACTPRTSLVPMLPRLH